jgi:diketogulonate reductase-like aldo/keto reductase
MLTRSIPSTGEALPVIGCGTWRAFNVGASPAERLPLHGVLRTLLDAGGTLVDSSPMYGRAEAVVGATIEALGARDAAHRGRAFLATKVWCHGREAGIAQMSRSLALLRVPRLDLVQIHNLVDWRTHLPTLRAWKAEGRVRHVGITHFKAGEQPALEAVMRAETIDFVQVNYSLGDRAAERSLLPLAAERGIAVLVNRPFGMGSLVRRLERERLPGLAAELGCAGWPELALKYVLAHEAVTCVIPGTASPGHMAANARAGLGPLPDAALRQRILTAAGL